MTFKISAIEKILTHLENQTSHEILWSELGEAQKEFAVIKHTKKEVEIHSDPTLRDELMKWAPQILEFPTMIKNDELLDLSVFSVCGADMLFHAVQINALMKTLDNHPDVQYHMIAALKLHWEIIYYG